MLQKKRFGNDGAGTAWGDGPDCCYEHSTRFPSWGQRYIWQNVTVDVDCFRYARV
jgi:hypothetical protein